MKPYFSLYLLLWHWWSVYTSQLLFVYLCEFLLPQHQIIDFPNHIILHISYPELLFSLTYFVMNGASCICQRRNGDPLRVYMDLEAGRKRSGFEDIFISYHAKDDVQSTYAGALFHNNRNYHVSSYKNNVRVLNFPPFFFVCFM